MTAGTFPGRYQILTEWDELELEAEAEPVGAGVVRQCALCRRDGEDLWAVVSWQLSRHSGRWLLDSLSVAE
jgi:hypothetical protein